MTDIVERLRGQHADCENAQEAASEITALREKLAKAERERDEALNELDAVYAALGTSDAEGAPEAAVTIESIFCERDALQARVERLEKALTNAVLAFIAQMDVVMKEPHSDDRDKMLARLINALEIENDRARYFALGVDFRTDEKKPLKR